VEVRPSRNTSTLEIENFMESDQEITLRVNERVQQEEIPAGEVKAVDIDTPAGQTTASLEEDPVTSDNTAYISIPGENELEIVYIADNENRFFREAVNSIPGTSYQYAEPPIQGTVSGDIFVVGETSEILQKTVQNIDTQVQNGKSAILFGQAGLNQHNFDSAPAELGPRLNTSVEIQEPLRTTIGATEMYETSNVTGKSMSDPSGAMIRRDYGQGEVLLYNIQDEDFRYEFLYPVFWKKVFQELSNTPSVEEANVRTGSEITGTEITTPDGDTFEEVVTTHQTGFYETPGQSYAANMESSEESGSAPLSFESKPRLMQDAKQNVQYLAAIALAVLALLELLYLMWLGEL
jgi:hypothetical protein